MKSQTKSTKKANKTTNNIDSPSTTQLPNTFTSKSINKNKSRKRFTILSVLIGGIISSLFLQRYIAHHWQEYSDMIFGQHIIIQFSDKLNVLKEAMFYIAALQFVIAFFIMNLRIVGQKISPVGETDPLYISLLNRILSNNLEQSLIFFGMYSYVLLSKNSGSQTIETRLVYTLPLLFLIGRVLFTFLYILATIVKISSVRSGGFFFTFGVNVLIFEHVFKCSNFFTKFMFE